LETKRNKQKIINFQGPLADGVTVYETSTVQLQEKISS